MACRTRRMSRKLSDFLSCLLSLFSFSFSCTLCVLLTSANGQDAPPTDPLSSLSPSPSGSIKLLKHNVWVASVGRWGVPGSSNIASIIFNQMRVIDDCSNRRREDNNTSRLNLASTLNFAQSIIWSAMAIHQEVLGEVGKGGSSRKLKEGEIDIGLIVKKGSSLYQKLSIKFLSLTCLFKLQTSPFVTLFYNDLIPSFSLPSLPPSTTSQSSFLGDLSYNLLPASFVCKLWHKRCA